MFLNFVTFYCNGNVKKYMNLIIFFRRIYESYYWTKLWCINYENSEIYLAIVYIWCAKLFIYLFMYMKVEEGFQLGSVDGIATAVHHLLGRIEEEASLTCC